MKPGDIVSVHVDPEGKFASYDGKIAEVVAVWTHKGNAVQVYIEDSDAYVDLPADCLRPYRALPLDTRGKASKRDG